jgi:tetratricopeptide (TPR) repeat protein
VATLDALLPAEREGTAAPLQQTAVITAIDGTAGIGKTTLAVWWAHRVQHRFPDGVLYTNLSGYGPGEPAATAEVLDGFLRALGVRPERIPAGPDARAGLFRSLLAGRRVLIMLDNARHADQVRPLLPGTSGCVVVVTSRDNLTGLVVTDGARRLTVDLLAEHEAVQLVTGVIGTARADAETAAVKELVRWCARLPLALRIAAGRAAAYPHSTVADVVAELADERARLDVLSTGGDERAAVRAVFNWSYQGLSVEQARVFRRLGLHFGPEVSVDAAAALAGSDPSTARRVLEELAQAHLIEPVDRGRYRFHDLLRAYALDQTARHDDPADQDQAQRRLLDWYAYAAHTCERLVYAIYSPSPWSLAVSPHPIPISDPTHALTWLTAERDNLFAALDYAARHGLHRHTLHLAESLGFLRGLGGWEASIDIGSRGIAAAQQSLDRHAEVLFFLRRGSSLLRLRRWDEAEADLDRALVLARDLDDRLRVGTLLDRGRMSVEYGRFVEALRYLEEALPLSRGIDTGRLEAVVECNLSRTHTGLGHYRQALHHAENELILSRQCGDIDGETVALHDLARAWQGLGEHQKTIALCRKAVALDHIATSLDETVAKPLATLAVSLHHTGDTASAIACWEEAATVFNDQNLPLEAHEVRERARRAAEQI